MARLILLWNRPAHLSDAEVAAWVGGEAHRLAAIPGVDAGRLTRLRRASEHQRMVADWMMELVLADGADRRTCMDAAPCREWLADLSLLGMHPAAVYADEGLRLHRGDA